MPVSFSLFNPGEFIYNKANQPGGSPVKTAGFNALILKIYDNMEL